GAVVGDHLQIGGGVAAHARERAAANAIALDHDIGGAENVDAVAVLSGPAGAREDSFDAVVDHQRAVVAGLGAPHQYPIVGGGADDVAGNDQALRVERENGGARRIGHGRSGHLALDLGERDAVAAGGEDLAIGDAHRVAASEVDEAATFRQGVVRP